MMNIVRVILEQDQNTGAYMPSPSLAIESVKAVQKHFATMNVESLGYLGEFTFDGIMYEAQAMESTMSEAGHTVTIEVRGMHCLKTHWPR